LKASEPGFSDVAPNGGNVDKTNRPLNRYVANALNVFHCPADHGDADVLGDGHEANLLFPPTPPATADPGNAYW
jgi:hypothetical protein